MNAILALKELNIYLKAIGCFCNNYNSVKIIYKLANNNIFSINNLI